MSEPLEVPAALEGERVDRAVATLTGWSRAEIGRMCEEGDILLAGRPVAKSRRLHAGELVELLAEPVVATPPAPEPMDLELRHVDDDVVVVAKPAGVVVHPGAGHRAGTLVNGLLARFPELAGVGDAARPGIVHRLDRDTSGLMVVARTAEAYDALVDALAMRSVDRRYTALVWGSLDAPTGEIDAPIGRSSARRTRMAVREGGKESRTTYEVERSFDVPRVTLLRCRLETGRTHQIRVHLSAIGHPVVGDAAYRGARPGIDLDRPFLHAGRLAFDHPRLGTHVEFEEPLPRPLAEVLERLG